MIWSYPQLSSPDQVLVNVSDSPYQQKNFKDLRESWLAFANEDLRSLSTLTSTAGALVADKTDAGETGP